MEPSLEESRRIWLNEYYRFVDALGPELLSVAIIQHVKDPLAQQRILVDELARSQAGDKYARRLLAWCLDWLIRVRNHFTHQPFAVLSSVHIRNLGNFVLDNLVATLTDLKVSQPTLELARSLSLRLSAEIPPREKYEKKGEPEAFLKPATPEAEPHPLPEPSLPDSLKPATLTVVARPPRPPPSLSHQFKISMIPDPAVENDIGWFKKRYQKELLGKKILMLDGLHAGTLAQVHLWNGNNLVIYLEKPVGPVRNYAPFNRRIRVSQHDL